MVRAFETPSCNCAQTIFMLYIEHGLLELLEKQFESFLSLFVIFCWWFVFCLFVVVGVFCYAQLLLRLCFLGCVLFSGLFLLSVLVVQVVTSRLMGCELSTSGLILCCDFSSTPPPLFAWGLFWADFLFLGADWV